MDFATVLTGNTNLTIEKRQAILNEFVIACGYVEGSKTDFFNTAIINMIKGKIHGARMQTVIFNTESEDLGF